AFGYWRESGRFTALRSNAVVLATGGAGKAWKVTSNSWEYTGDGIAMAMEAGADLIDMEMVQFHPTGMVWPPSVRGILVTEGVRGDGGTLRNSTGKRFMFEYIPAFFKSETAETEAEADRWYDDKKNNRRTPDLLPRDEVARAINSEAKAGTSKLDIDAAQVEDAARSVLQPFNANGNENPYTIHAELQECMQANVGIIRTEAELKIALATIAQLKKRLSAVQVEGNRQFNPGWHLALDLRAMLTVSEAVTVAALERKESRGGHTREDFPKTDAQFARVNVVLRRKDDPFIVGHEPFPVMPDDLKQLFEEKA